MAFHEYELQSEWRVRARLEEVAELVAEGVADPRALVRYWPEANVDYRVLEWGHSCGLHRVLEAHTKGFLPYRLRWRITIVVAEFPRRYRMVTEGDLAGTGTWTIDPDGDDVVVRFDWRVRAEKPLLRFLSVLLRPLFAANHRWAMARGERVLRRELARRRSAAAA